MLFKYKAIKNNNLISKEIEAENEETVLAFLQKNDYFPVEIKPSLKNQFAILNTFIDRVSFNDIVDMTRQLAIMLNAGLTIVDSLDILRNQIKRETFKKLVNDIDKQVKGGASLSTVLRKYPQYFPNLYIALIKSGEASGKLSEILLKLADNLENQREFNTKLRGAMVYPLVVVSAMVVVIFIMITFVLPKMLALYKDFNVDLPLPTKILIAVSSFASSFWPFIIIFTVLGIFLVRRFLKTKAGRRQFDIIALKIPVINNVIRQAALVDSTRTLSILTGAGVSILDALTIIVDTTNNVIYQDAFQRVYKSVEKGQSLGNSLSAEGVFPPILVQMTIVGENTGHLDDTLERLSKYFEFQSEAAIKAITTLIEPAILVILGIGVAFLVLAVILPIYKLTESFN